MSYTASGNVYVNANVIGQNDHKFVIKNASTADTVNSHLALIGDSATNGQGPQILFSESGDAQAFAGATIGFVRTGANSQGYLQFGTRASSGDASTVTTTRMKIDGDLITVPTITEIRGDIASNKFAVGNMGDASSQMMVSSRGFLTFNVSNTGSAKDATTRMQINASGKVGINETNDARTQLEVKATTSSRNTVTRILTLNANGDAIQPYEPFGTGIIFEGFDYAGGGGTSTSRDYAYLDARIETSGSTPVDFTSRLVFATNSGGSSTTTPTTKLVIKGNGQMVNTMDLSGLSTNLLLANLNDTDGDTAGIGFSMLDNGTYIKSGIYFERTTTQGRGDLIFAMNDTVDGQNVALADEAMRITPTKKVEIGRSTAQSIAPLDVRHNGSAIEFGHTNNGDWYFGTVGSYGSAGNPFISFSCMNEQSANTWTTKGIRGNIITQESNGNLQFQHIAAINSTGQTPTLNMELYNDGRLHPVGGIFLGSTNNSNLLDDYEEGPWTPEIYYQDLTDRGNATNTTQTGIYTKVGRKVTVMFRLIWSITGTPATDNIGIKNLPFNGQALSNNLTYAEIPCILKGYTNPSTGGRGTLTLTLPNNNSDIAMFNDSNNIGNMGGVIGGGSHEIRFSFTYTTDQ